jgi:hypothetical protein
MTAEDTLLLLQPLGPGRHPPSAVERAGFAPVAAAAAAPSGPKPIDDDDEDEEDEEDNDEKEKDDKEAEDDEEDEEKDAKPAEKPGPAKEPPGRGRDRKPGPAKEPPGRSARAELDERVAARMKSRRLPRHEAARAVLGERPKLRARLLTEDRAARQAGGSPAAGDTAGEGYRAGAAAVDPIAEVDRRIKALEARGVGHAKACCEVFASDPELHRRYLAAHNPQVDWLREPAGRRK